MKTRVNICTEDWCNLVFDGKNKDYGAYAIRTHASLEKVKSLFITILLTTSIAIIPLIKGHNRISVTDNGFKDPTILTNIPVCPPKPINIEAPQAPKPMRPMIRFISPIITTDEPTSEIPVNEQIFHRNISIGSINVDGTEYLGSEIFDGGIDGSGGKPKIFTICEKMPQFKGGIEELKKFLRKTIRYPESAKANEISGRVIVQFIVDQNGKIKDAKILRGLDDSCNNEALRVLNQMPAWNPGMQNGIAVPVYFTLPIIFSLGHN